MGVAVGSFPVFTVAQAAVVIVRAVAGRPAKTYLTERPADLFAAGMPYVLFEEGRHET
ncbi:hypothetical protein [Actibacterium sp. D379-3]